MASATRNIMISGAKERTASEKVGTTGFKTLNHTFPQETAPGRR